MSHLPAIIVNFFQFQKLGQPVIQN